MFSEPSSLFSCVDPGLWIVSTDTMRRFGVIASVPWLGMSVATARALPLSRIVWTYSKLFWWVRMKLKRAGMLNEIQLVTTLTEGTGETHPSQVTIMKS